MNIRHDLDPIKVKEQIEKAVAKHEKHRVYSKEEAKKTLESYQQCLKEGTAHHWSRVPDGGSHIDPMIDKWIKIELEHYSKVRVIELSEPVLTHNNELNKFILVYGDVDDMTVERGTGPFSTLEKAEAWFFNGGR